MYYKTNKGEYMNYEKEYDKMNAEVKKLIDDTETKMFKLIEDYNEKVEESDEYENFSKDEDANEFTLVNTVDLSNLFTQLNEYVTDYSD
tara:strand:+ start:13 stop:279 length:267 start_codon:yes stop_codon:yes gene_type:complete